MLRIRHKMRPTFIKRSFDQDVEGGPEYRLLRLRQMVSGLVRYERIEPKYQEAEEARQYAERLIYLAIKNGDRHKHTMDLADYWLLEKDLVHKLFKVLVPRFSAHHSSFTALHRKANDYVNQDSNSAVLELKGNPYPPVNPHKRATKYLLSNILISAARKDFYANKKQLKEKALLEAKQSENSLDSNEEKEDSSLNTDSEVLEESSSSVDPPPDSSEKR